MGPSGSGKSTLLNLSLIDRPTSGSLNIEGKQINFNETDKNDILRATNYIITNKIIYFQILTLLKIYI